MTCGTHPHEDYTEAAGWKDYMPRGGKGGGGSAPPPGGDVAEVRCLNPNCETLNRVRRYRIQEVPTCKKCGWLLPEPITTQMVRFVRANPLLWSAFGASLAIAGFVFLDRYSPSQGLIWNAVNGSTAGFPTRYVVAAGALLFFMGFALAAKK